MNPVAIERRTRALLLDSQRRVLERIASGAPLEEILETLVRLIEEQAEMRCALLLADEAQQRLRFVAAPNIPEDYKLGIAPYLLIAPNMGSCGTAAYRREPVYTEDTATDPLWENCGGIAVRNGLRAIWSTPILSDANTVLGTFAMYYGEPRLPAPEHVQLIDMATQMARLAIEAKLDETILQTVFEDAPDGIVITDLSGKIVRVNRAFADMLGYAPADLRSRGMAEIVEGLDHAALVKELVSSDGELASERRYRARSGEFPLVRERSSLRRDTTLQPRYVLTHVVRKPAPGADLLEVLSPREREVLELVITGRTSKEIAAGLGITPASIDTYRSRIMFKLQLEDLPALVRFAIRHGITSA